MMEMFRKKLREGKGGVQKPEEKEAPDEVKEEEDDSDWFKHRLKFSLDGNKRVRSFCLHEGECFLFTRQFFLLLRMTCQETMTLTNTFWWIPCWRRVKKSSINCKQK